MRFAWQEQQTAEQHSRFYQLHKAEVSFLVKMVAFQAS
jgi:hypothetical protein